MPHLLAALGALLYLVQAVIYAHTSIPGLDEGSYLIKGYLFLRGVYSPFEPYGPLTNKAPFAFLIPGYEQILFGPGLRTGRYFAIFFGLLTLLGVWITARRWAGPWLAAGTIWVYALSSTVIRTQAITASEVIISCMLAWMCVFTLGSDRPLWQIISGSLLGALTVLTRQNMIFVLPMLILYVFWQHGRQKGLWSLAVGAGFFLVVHIYYWPNILSIWAPWVPRSLTPFLNAFRLPKDAIALWQPSIDFWNRMNSFFQGIRFHFIPVVGSIFTVLLWSRPRAWRTDPAFRAVVFLAPLYFILFFLHAWAAVASQYESYSCVYCFLAYLAFFDPLGILLGVIAFSALWNRKPSGVEQVISVIISCVLAAGIGFSMFDSLDPRILNLPIPRMRDGRILPGTTELADFLENKFSLSLSLIKHSVAAFLGLAVGIGVVLIALIIWKRMSRSDLRPAYGYLFANSFLIVGFILSPLMNIDGGQVNCTQDLISQNEQVGHYLAGIIPPNSLVYWDGGLSFTPMDYVVPAARIFPPQINDGYSYRKAGDTDTLYRLGYWNDVLNLQWRNEASIFIIEAKRFSYWRPFFEASRFEEYPPPPVAPSCEDGSGIRIFHKLP